MFSILPCTHKISISCVQSCLCFRNGASPGETRTHLLTVNFEVAKWERMRGNVLKRKAKAMEPDSVVPVDVCADDVLIGNGKAFSHRPANQRYNEMIIEYSWVCRSTGMSMSIVQREILSKTQGRFLRNVDEDKNTGIPLTEAELNQKIGQAIRYRMKKLRIQTFPSQAAFHAEGLSVHPGGLHPTSVFGHSYDTQTVLSHQTDPSVLSPWHDHTRHYMQGSTHREYPLMQNYVHSYCTVPPQQSLLVYDQSPSIQSNPSYSTNGWWHMASPSPSLQRNLDEAQRHGHNPERNGSNLASHSLASQVEGKIQDGNDDWSSFCAKDGLSNDATTEPIPLNEMESFLGVDQEVVAVNDEFLEARKRSSYFKSET